MENKGNDFTREEIKNSVEYRWRKWNLKSIFYIILIYAAVAFTATVTVSLVSLDDAGEILDMLVFFLIAVGIAVIFVSPFAVHEGYKILRFLRHYGELEAYTVALDKFSTSYLSRGSIYYTVTVPDGGYTRQVDTNPYFSGHFSAAFPIDEYHGKKVVGLYDRENNKFYVIKKI